MEMFHGSKVTYLSILFILLASCTQKPQQYVYNEGFIYGTIYHTTYSTTGNIDLQQEITNELNRLDLSFSTFKPNSIISQINTNELLTPDSLFVNVFNRSKEIWKETNGAFDPTVMPLVNAWGFGFKHRENVTSEMIDSLMEFVGLEKIWMQDTTIVKSDSRIMLDFSAIAKGYTVDLIGHLLEEHGCDNYMVEIGGEMITKGVNPKGKPWRVGINQPNEDEPIATENFQAILEVSGKAIATSGNYRNFYEKDGKKYAHTINPATGFPVQHSLLSATVIANDCMTADAFATAFMVLGKDSAISLASNLNGMEVYLIYADEDGTRKTISTKGFSNFIGKKQHD
jgi:FAD:protein FMN transferase